MITDDTSLLSREAFASFLLSFAIWKSHGFYMGQLKYDGTFVIL